MTLTNAAEATPNIFDAINEFPQTFTLRSVDFRHLTFRIEGPPASFVDGSNVWLVLEVCRDGKWMQFGRFSPAELRPQVKPFNN